MNKLGTISLDNDILAKANIGLWAFELDEGKEPRMYVDDTMLGLIGLDHQVSPEETYHAWYDHIDPAHYDAVAASVEKMTSGEHAEVQYPWHHPNGDIWIVRCGGVRNYAYTKGIRIEGTHQNVSELVHYQKKGLQDILAAMSDNFLSIYVLNPYTGSFEALLSGSSYDKNDDRDYSKVDFYEDVADRSGSIVHPDDKPIIEKMYAKENLVKVLEDGVPTEFVVRWPTGKGNECVYMKNKLVPFVDSDGTKKLIIGVLDITKDKISEMTLKERNVYLEYFLRGFNSAYIVDLGNDEFEILYMNHEFKNVFRMNGKKHDMETFIEEHIHPDDRELMRKMSNSANIMKMLKDDSEITFTAREVFGDVVKTMRVLIVRGADNTRAAVAFMDISDELEKEKEYSRKLEAASIAKSSFLFNMSHDIRTPMNAILGYSDRLLKHIDDMDLVKSSAEKIKSSGEYLLSLINNVLDMAKIESDKVTLDEEIYDIREKAKILCDVFEVSMKNKNLTFNVDFSDIKNTVVWYDSLKLKQIMLNLLSNAVKYTPNGGTIIHTMRQIPCDKEGYGRYEIKVTDNGIGMSEEFVKHIFEQFARSDDSITKETQGTGLGMSIVGKLVDIMGGTITIDSELNKGTDITVTLDLKIASDKEIERLRKGNESSISSDKLEGLKILLVEDNEMNREIAIDILEDEGCIVKDTAENGVNAIGKVKESKPGDYDLILMDVQMPVMDGYEAARRIRALDNKELANIPIIAMTANAFEEDRKDALAAGMNDHVTKPVDVKKLKEAIARFSK